MEVLRQDGYVRYDFAWYGFGHADRTFGLCGYAYGRGHHLWMNSYRRAPVAIRTIHSCGWLTGEWGDLPRAHWANGGSISEPTANWSLRIGRAYIGGDTPRVWRRFLAWRFRRRVARDPAMYEGWEE